MINIHISHEIYLRSYVKSAGFTSKNSVFGEVKLAKNAYLDIYNYSRHGIRFDACGSFSLPDGSGFGENVMIVGADKSSSGYIDNKKMLSWFLVKV